MLSRNENERLTRVGGGTPMGKTLRRYWQPALLASEVAENDGAPVRVRLLGEDLIAFRDSDGNVGLVDAFCPHRRAPLFFGRNEDCGLRCVYHGWKFDVRGACVDMPSEPPDSLFKTKVTLTAYPTWEGGGIVWAYLGPPELRPEPPDYEFVRAPETHRFMSKTREDCNWLQGLEGGLDTAHPMFLHRDNRGDLTYLRNYGMVVPQIEVEKTDDGYYYSGIRDAGEQQWVRGYKYAMPGIQFRALVGGLYRKGDEFRQINGHIWVPIDDTHTWVYNFMYSYDPAQPLPPERVASYEKHAGRGPDDLTADFGLKKNLANDYEVDRERQKTLSFTGIAGVNTQDFAVQEGMGPIVDRSREHLGTSDKAVIAMRALLLEAVDAVEKGRTPRGVRAAGHRDGRALDHLVAKDLDWHVALKDELLAKF
jgi:phthalate 4,5-dioxygenase oxygenase subunit